MKPSGGVKLHHKSTAKRSDGIVHFFKPEICMMPTFDDCKFMLGPCCGVGQVRLKQRHHAEWGKHHVFG